MHSSGAGYSVGQSRSQSKNRLQLTVYRAKMKSRLHKSQQVSLRGAAGIVVGGRTGVALQSRAIPLGRWKANAVMCLPRFSGSSLVKFKYAQNDLINGTPFQGLWGSIFQRHLNV